MHIGILQTDSVRPDFVDEHTDYPDMFEKLFSAVQPDLRFTRVDVRQTVPGSVDCDVYLITGSRHSVYDDLPWIEPLVQFLRDALAAEKKIIGICFGHQLIAHFFGGEVGLAPVGWCVGVHTQNVVRKASWMGGTEIAEDEDDWSASNVSLLSSHRDQVLELPDGAEIFAGSDRCPVAGFTIGSQIITIQGHPEWSPEYATALLNLRRDDMQPQVYEQGIADMHHETNPAVLVRWMLNFVAGD